MEDAEKLKKLMKPPIEDPKTCYWYVCKVMKKRWPEAESLIFSVPEFAGNYAYYISDRFRSATSKRKRYAELARAVQDWKNDSSDFDERIAPKIEAAMRETDSRHFPDS